MLPQGAAYKEGGPVNSGAPPPNPEEGSLAWELCRVRARSSCRLPVHGVPTPRRLALQVLLIVGVVLGGVLGLAFWLSKAMKLEDVDD